MLFGGTQIVENVVTARTKYNMRGYTQLLKSDESFLESWELIKIERLSFAKMSPEMRFLYGLTANGLAVININRAMDDAKSKQQSQPEDQGQSVNQSQSVNQTSQSFDFNAAFTVPEAINLKQKK
jgi:hypothetical protein